ncbi:MAG: hypothetical protein ACFE96_05615 [Candidatus Hermodarchaeota archaeon]
MEIHKRKEKGKYIWILPLISGFFSLFSILTPTAIISLGTTIWAWWMWDFTTVVVFGNPPINAFLRELDFLIPSLVTTGAMLFCTVNLFILSGSTRKSDTKYFIFWSIFSAVLSIGMMVYYAFSMASAFEDGIWNKTFTFPSGYHFWNMFYPGPGIYCALISAILGFVGIGLFIKSLR